MDIKIRDAKFSEARAIREVKRDSFIEEMKMYDKDPETFVTPEGIAKEEECLVNEHGNNYNYVAVCNDKIVGGGTAIDEGNATYYVKIIYVSSEGQNRGIGSMILSHMLAQFPDAKQWHLETPYKSFRNHHFYEKFGFRKVGETEPEEDGFHLFLYYR